MQEYIEATSFQHYLQTQHLITLEEAQATIPGGIVLTEQDYLLGLFDLVGEMMKFAITNMAISGSLPRGGGGGGGASPSPKKEAEEEEEEEGEKDVKTESNGGADILTDLRSLRTCFAGLDLSPGHAPDCGGGGGGGRHLEKDVRQKMEVMRTSVEKVERAVYGIIIRGRERWAPDWGAENERGRDQVEIYWIGAATQGKGGEKIRQKVSFLLGDLNVLYTIKSQISVLHRYEYSCICGTLK